MQYAISKNKKDILRAKVKIGGKYMVLCDLAAAFDNICMQQVTQPKNIQNYV